MGLSAGFWALVASSLLPPPAALHSALQPESLKLSGGFPWIRRARGLHQIVVGHIWGSHTPILSAPEPALRELLALGSSFCNPCWFNQGYCRAPFPPTTHHSSPGPDGCLCEQSSISMATQSSEVLLLFLFTKWLG